MPGGYTATGHSLPADVAGTVPIILAEFHFGTMDVGLLAPGLHSATTQNQRARVYAQYMRTALRLPNIIGAHWFQYRDQATTGRGDGENYQIGLVDHCDTPYPETIAAVRKVGYAMYQTRMANE